MTVEVKVPSVGESITEVYIGSWRKQEGDEVAKDEPLVEIETDKATVEVYASASGKLTRVLKHSGDSATVGEVIAHLDENARGEGEQTAAAPEQTAAAPAQAAAAG